MMNIKNLLSFLLVLAMLATLGGCANPPEEAVESSDGGMTIVAANFPAYDFARAVAGDANVTLLLPPGSEAHSYEPTPADVIAIQECSLFIYAGGENEEWATQMIQNLELDPDKAIAMLDVVEPLEEERVEGMEPERGHSHDHGKDCDHDHEDHEDYDEHVWTSPKNAALIVHAICDKLSQICPADASEFAANADRYKKKLERLDGEFREVVDNGRRKTLVFADRFPVRYFTEEYGLKYYAAFPGCSAESEASPKTVAFLIDRVREENIPVVFKTELSNGRIACAVAESTGAKVLTFTSCHNLTKDEFQSGATYISLMEGNLQNLREALN